MDWKLTIRKVQNGFIVTTQNLEKEEGDEQENEFVFNTDEDELQPFGDMLWEVAEYFGVTYSKHNERNLVIKVVKNKEK